MSRFAATELDSRFAEPGNFNVHLSDDQEFLENAFLNVAKNTVCPIAIVKAGSAGEAVQLMECWIEMGVYKVIPDIYEPAPKLFDRIKKWIRG